MSKKIRIFIDAEVLIVPHFSGIGHYTLEVLRALDKLVENRDDVEITLGVYFRRIRKIKSYGFRNFRYRRTPFPLRISNAMKIRNKQIYYDLFFGKKVYLFPNFTSWPLLFSKSVPIIYDLSFEKFPQFADPRNQQFLSDNVKKSAEWAEKIVTISSNSKQEIVDYYGTKPSDVEIVYPGIDQSQFFRWPANEVEKVKARYGVFGKYILYVGNLEPRKNLKTLLLAYEKLPTSIRKEYSILLVGARGWLDDEIFDIIERLRIAGNHIQQPQGYVKDEDRAALYSGASLFVYPSLYEGFGIPPVEAMACGVPTITSNNSSLPEAVGDAAKTVDAEDVDGLSDTIQKVLGDEKLQEEMRTKGFEQADKYSWDHEAQKLLNLLIEVGRK